MSNWRRVALDPLAWWLSRRELRRLMALAGDDPGAVVAAAANYQGRGFYARIAAVQERDEIVGLASEVRSLQPEVIVEIGTFKGGTLFVFCRVFPAIREIVSIDLPGGEFGGGYHFRRRRLYREFLFDRPGASMELIQGDSHKRDVQQELELHLAGRPIDFLYIDGDHTYEGVRSDFEMYSPLVRSGGVAVFHDIATLNAGCGVGRLWAELRDLYQSEVWIAPSSNKGIGLLFF